MRTLLQHINSLNTKDRKTLATYLHFSESEKVTVKNIIQRMSSHIGIEIILSQCSAEETLVLGLLIKDDVHYRDIEHQLHLPIQQIEIIAQSLCSKSIVYILKNRQLLSNKLDKICLYNELRQLINPIDKKILQKHCNEIITSITTGTPISTKIHLSTYARDFLKLCIKRGGVVSVKYAIQKLGLNISQSVLNELVSNNIIKIFHVFTSHAYGLILVEPQYMVYKFQDSKNYINNHYMALIAMMHAYDCISSKGLFLTQDGNLRKSDVDKITKVLAPISIHSTTHKMTAAQTSQLALYLLNITNCISITSSNVNVTLSHLHKALVSPHLIVQMILNNIDKYQHELFPNPIPIDSKIIKSVLHIIKKYISHTVQQYIHIYFLDSLHITIFNSSQSVDDYFDVVKKEVQNAIDFLCILGIIKITNNILQFTDIGELILQQDNKKNFSVVKGTKAIYINPDFSLVIPYHEIPSEISYILLLFTDIISIDVTLHAKISKNSVIKAIKRGMEPNIFINTLQHYAKNPLPQNIFFQFNEWIEHTPAVTIQRGFILKSSKKEFVDELVQCLPKGVILERMSDTHLLINESSIDTVIKYAHKKDILLTLEFKI